ncbi:SCP2 sterol-binding domain-containing protein [Afifella sp. JA880]|uniref:ubiquinone anaerobic biosynthesis accessory factor UbiT n=1 Tax=Afifella sp. JA880 TaxID=2975280 RepID=UPI0021BB0611|nr:SCP2 sterol-binding domain-containing protein [Afifella sp. JA880]MCT8268172.1 SCP2 sterol-binding domain-containing protein [Afifella sp. JA880]
MQTSPNIVAVPAPVRLLMRPLPLLPLRLMLERLVSGLIRRRPGLFLRLDHHAEKVFLIDPTDLPFVFRLKPDPEHPTVEPLRRERAGAWDGRIAGPLGALMGMIHGTFDGDALFFSRDIIIEGDTEAVLALRNALDDAEIDLMEEAAIAFGPFRPAIEPFLRNVTPVAARITGLPLSRSDETEVFP